MLDRYYIALSTVKKDINQLAKFIVEQATDENKEGTSQPEKNPAAVALVRLGGLKGGKARADKLNTYLSAM